MSHVNLAALPEKMWVVSHSCSRDMIHHFELPHSDVMMLKPNRIPTADLLICLRLLYKDLRRNHEVRSDLKQLGRQDFSVCLADATTSSQVQLLYLPKGMVHSTSSQWFDEKLHVQSKQLVFITWSCGSCGRKLCWALTQVWKSGEFFHQPNPRKDIFF